MQTKIFVAAILRSGSLSVGAASAATYVMDFEAHPITANAATTSTPYTEDGMTITPVVESARSHHYDVYNSHPDLSPDPTNRNIVLHEGNDGSRPCHAAASGRRNSWSGLHGWTQAQGSLTRPSANQKGRTAFLIF